MPIIGNTNLKEFFMNNMRYRMKSKSLFSLLAIITIFLFSGCSKSPNHVAIGKQVWMGKNLDVDNYRNGDPIPEVKDAGKWASLKTGAWCYYKNDSKNGEWYGKLYNWYAVNDPRGLAPEGWHIPTEKEFEALNTAVNGNSNALKAIGQGTGSGAGINTSGFSALLTGIRNYDGNFIGLGDKPYHWSFTEGDANTAYYLYMNNNNSDIISGSAAMKEYGFGVRCVKD